MTGAEIEFIKDGTLPIFNKRAWITKIWSDGKGRWDSQRLFFRVIEQDDMSGT
jgi:hypothetical protein